MVNYTPNLKLAKPTLSDVADITVISNNFDILDSALAKMVTTDSPQEITGSKTFSGTVIVNGHNLRNAVTTDEEQIITGAKTFNSNVTLSKLTPELHLSNNTYKAGTTPNTSRFSHLWFSDSEDKGLALLQHRYGNDGTNQLRIFAYSYDGNEQKSSIMLHSDGNVYTNAPSANAGSTAIVNKAYVEALDGVTNNILHRTGVETIKNYKIGTVCNYIAPSEAVNHNGQYMKLIRFKTSAVRILGTFTYVIGGSTGVAQAKFCIDPHANQFYLYDFYANDSTRSGYIKDICLGRKDNEWYVIMPAHRYHQPTMIIEQILNYGCYWITDRDTLIEYYNVTDAVDNPNWLATKPINGVDGWSVITPIIMAQVTQ